MVEKCLLICFIIAFVIYYIVKMFTYKDNSDINKLEVDIKDLLGKKQKLENDLNFCTDSSIKHTVSKTLSQIDNVLSQYDSLRNNNFKYRKIDWNKSVFPFIVKYKYNNKR